MTLLQKIIFSCLALVNLYSIAPFFNNLLESINKLPTPLNILPILPKNPLSIIEKASGTPLDLLIPLVRSAYQNQNHEHKNRTAIIRISNDLVQEEQDYLKKRLPLVKTALEKLLGINLADNELPRIALCGSGGGYRAMISTLGSFLGAEEIGLLDCCVYNAGLSGSTWAIAGWLQSTMTIQKYVDHIGTKISKDLISEVSNDAIVQIAQVIAQRLAFDQKISVIDLYGGFLAEKLLKDFGKKPQLALLAEQEQRVKNALNLFPIYTAMIDTAKIDSNKKYEWIEFTPYEIGAISSQAFIPSWALGRAFNTGSSKDFAPGVSLGFCMGIWGSALSVNAKEMIDSFKSDAPATFDLLGVKIPMPFVFDKLSETLEKNSQVDTLSKQRFYPAQVNNWMFGMDGKFKDMSQLTLIDAGIDFNLPTPPLLRTARNVSVIIILDASGETKDAPELRKAEQYARKHNLKFPTIDYTKVNALCSIHTDTNPEVPTVLYIPLMKNTNYNNGWDPRTATFTSTFNFAYSQNEVKTLSGLTRQNMVDSKELIVQALKEAVKKEKKAITN